MSEYEYKWPVLSLDLTEVHEPTKNTGAEPLFVDNNIVKLDSQKFKFFFILFFDKASYILIILS